MGSSTSKPDVINAITEIQSISNDYELVIKASKELEYILESEFQSSGRGLHEKITAAQQQHLQQHPQVIKDMRFLATIRNKLIHERGFDVIPNRKAFITTFQKSATVLTEIVMEQKRAKAGDAVGGSLMSDSCAIQ
mmetsp:Transcript_32252/g.67240  ORF Transcript_32252/g.67240 Transcript_32252/m.67240 type:complete len:136 (+) Transcript_32252:100-507(+)